MKFVKVLVVAAILTCSLSSFTEGKRKRSSRIDFDLMPDERICQKKKCGRRPKGSWCQVVVNEKGKRQPACVCPTSCNVTDVSPVCSVFGRQFENKCLLHKEGCRKRKNIKIAYEGACIASQAKCRGDELRQFPFRLLDWFVHLKDKDEFGTVDPGKSLSSISKPEMREVAEWKFRQLDKNNDDKLTNKELKRFRYALMPLEHCAKDFFKKCDQNKNKKLELEEWQDSLVEGGWTWLQHRENGKATKPRKPSNEDNNEATIQ